MKTCLEILLITFMTGSVFGHAQEIKRAGQVRVVLKNGSIIEGNLVRARKNSVVVSLNGLGTMVIKRKDIKEISSSTGGGSEDPGSEKGGTNPKPPQAKPEDKDGNEGDGRSAEKAPAIKPEAKRRLEELFKSYAEDRNRTIREFPRGREDFVERVRVLLYDTGPYVAHLLDNQEKNVPLPELAVALGSLREEKYIPTLQALSNSKNRRNREAAIEGLGRVGGEKAVKALMEILERGNPQAMRAAAQGLAKLGGDSTLRVVQKVKAALERRVDRPTGLIRCLVELKADGAVSTIAKYVSHSESHVRRSAVAALRRLGTLEAIDEIESALGDDDPQVRKEAILALGDLSSMDSVPELIELLDEDVDPGVRGNAHWALKKITGQGLSQDYERWSTWWEHYSRRRPPKGW